ncbi:unnamed protein product [Trichobilharzia regenti]|nr:unnamed protein product [Trichobilharzia regenti]
MCHFIKVPQNAITTTTTTTNTDGNLKRNNEISTNTRIYRRSRALPGNILLTSDQGLPMATTVTTTSTTSSTTTTAAAATTLPATVSRKPAPPPRLISIRSSTVHIPTSLTNSTYNTNVLSELSPELPLPVRVKRSQMSLDSTSSSSSSCSGGDNDESTSLQDATINGNNNLSREENKENRIHGVVDNHHHHRVNDDTGKLSTDYHRSTGGVGVTNPPPTVGTMAVTTPTTSTTTTPTTISGKLQVMRYKYSNKVLV